MYTRMLWSPNFSDGENYSTSSACCSQELLAYPPPPPSSYPYALWHTNVETKLICYITSGTSYISSLILRSENSCGLGFALLKCGAEHCMHHVIICIKSSVLPTLVGSGWLQPTLSSFFFSPLRLDLPPLTMLIQKWLCLTILKLSVTITQIILGRTPMEYCRCSSFYECVNKRLILKWHPSQL